jgi:hypothetical protein
MLFMALAPGEYCGKEQQWQVHQYTENSNGKEEEGKKQKPGPALRDRAGKVIRALDARNVHCLQAFFARLDVELDLIVVVQRLVTFADDFLEVYENFLTIFA